MVQQLHASRAGTNKRTVKIYPDITNPKAHPLDPRIRAMQQEIDRIPKDRNERVVAKEKEYMEIDDSPDSMEEPPRDSLIRRGHREDGRLGSVKNFTTPFF